LSGKACILSPLCSWSKGTDIAEKHGIDPAIVFYGQHPLVEGLLRRRGTGRCASGDDVVAIGYTIGNMLQRKLILQKSVATDLCDLACG
jgi:hypothetical protein